MIVRELLTIFGVKYDDAGVKKAEASIQNLIGNARVLVGALAGSAVVLGLKNVVEHQVEFAQQLDRTSKRLGIQTDALQELRYAAEQAGIEQRALDTALQKFMIRTAQAAQGTGSAIDTLKELGVVLKDSTGNLRAPSDLLAQAADGFAKISSQADRARIAQTLFEEEGVRLIDMLGAGSAGLNKMRSEAHLLGAVMSQESIQSSQSLWLVLKRIGYVFGSLGRSLIDTLMPALQKMANGFETLGTGLNQVFRHTTILKTAMGLLGVVAGALAIKMVIAFAPAILTFTAIAAAVGAVILAVDDLYNLFTGGESVTERFFEGIKGYFKGLMPNLELGGFTPRSFSVGGPSKISNQSNIVAKTNQNLKVDVHVKSGSNPADIGNEVARMVGLELDRVHRNTYLALVPG
jgi:hypothetical protein